MRRLLVTSSHFGFRRQPACCQTTLTAVSACSDRSVHPYLPDEAPRSHKLHPLHQAEGQCHANAFDDQRKINGRSLDRQPDDQEKLSYLTIKLSTQGAPAGDDPDVGTSQNPRR